MIWIIGFAREISQRLIGGTGDLANNITSFIGYIDFNGHYQSTFGQGVIETVDILYFVSLTAVALFLAIRVVEARRWS
jgi:hypothetical protein